MHIGAVMLSQAALTGVQFIVPILGQKHFGASDVQVLMLTMLPLVFAVVSIFWGAIFARFTISRYLLLYWATAGIPLLLMCFIQNAWQLVILFAPISAALCAFPAVNGELLRRLYPERRRGIAFAWVFAGSAGGGAIVNYAVGHLLADDNERFRWIMPGLAIVHLVGVLALGWFTRAVKVERAGRGGTGIPSVKALIEPVLHMNAVLKQDRLFFRYEAAFMTYGIGWMICFALLPLFVTKKLALGYGDIGEASGTAMQIAMFAAIIPMGLLNDRIGPTRISAIGFAIFALHPIALIFTTDRLSLAWASTIYGLASAAVNMGWLLGPMSFAPSPDKVPHYVAIHTTLVGLRGAVFQGLGVLLYWLTGDFTVAFIVAAAGYTWASIQMVQLWRLMRKPIGPSVLTP